MAVKRKHVVDSRAPRVDWKKLKKGPSDDDLREIPATTAADWEDADRVLFVDKDAYKKVRRLLEKRTKKVLQR
jgi:hypothetical protein